MSEWVTIKEAALLAGRSTRSIYDWVSNGVVRASRDATGVMLVRGVDVLEAESKVTRGRPKGKPNSRQMRI